MSGGHFDYNQSHIMDIAEEIEKLIKENDYSGDSFIDVTIDCFKEAVKTLKLAAHMVERIDYLICDDDSEVTFLERWINEKP